MPQEKSNTTSFIKCMQVAAKNPKLLQEKMHKKAWYMLTL